MSFCVAIDGPAAAGKGTIARAVADHFGFAHLDTGLLYRSVGAKTLTGTDAIKAAQTLGNLGRRCCRADLYANYCVSFVFDRAGIRDRHNPDLAGLTHAVDAVSDRAFGDIECGSNLIEGSAAVFFQHAHNLLIQMIARRCQIGGLG